MADNFENKESLYTKDELLSLGIYDLRELGRNVGVSSPTSMKKEPLVDAILSIIYGEAPRRNIGKGRGRPAKAKEKPSKLYVDLIEKIETPDLDSSFIYDEDVPYVSSFNYDTLLESKVASYQSPYVNDALNDENIITLKKAVISFEDGKVYARKLKFIQSEKDHEVPEMIVKDFNLKDSDVVEFLPDDFNKKVEQVIKVNGNFVSRLNASTGKNEWQEGVELYVNDDVLIKTNTSNIIYAPTMNERQILTEDIYNKLIDCEFSVVKVCFDKVKPSSIAGNDIHRAEFYATCIGDEFESLAMAEAAIERVKFYSTVTRKTAIVIDNLGWLISVIESFPKSIYGNFINKLANLSKAVNGNITVVCVCSHLPNEQVKTLSGLFDNIILSEGV